jgi:hypothetical protein
MSTSTIPDAQGACAGPRRTHAMLRQTHAMLRQTKVAAGRSAIDRSLRMPRYPWDGNAGRAGVRAGAHEKRINPMPPPVPSSRVGRSCFGAIGRRGAAELSLVPAWRISRTGGADAVRRAPRPAVAEGDR